MDYLMKKSYDSKNEWPVQETTVLLHVEFSGDSKISMFLRSPQGGSKGAKSRLQEPLGSLRMNSEDPVY